MKKVLQGKRVIITRAREQAEEFSRKLESLGATVIKFPTIRFAPPEDWKEVDEAIARLEDYDWLIFTSVNGVKFFLRRLKEKERPLSILEKLSIAAIGPSTAEEVEKTGLKVNYIPEAYIAEAVVEGFKGFGIEGRRALLPRAEKAREVIPRELGKLGMQVDVLTVYRTLPPERTSASRIAKMITKREVDLITFTSSSTVKNFVSSLQGLLNIKRDLRDLKIACIGPVTAETAGSLGLNVDIVAEKYTIDGLIESICQFYQG